MFIKRDIKNINRQLGLIADTDTNARLTTETFDKDVTELCNNINAVFDKRRLTVVEIEKSNAEFKRAITNISHDLRTPLTSAIGYAQMLRGSDLPAAQKSEYLDIIEQRLKSLSALMNNLFEYTQIAEGRIEFKTEKVNICNVLRDVLSQFYNDFTAKGFEISADIPDSAIYMSCDSASLTRAAQNLIRNALEHGFDRFELTAAEGEIVFANRVKNVAAIEIERIFDRFYTSDLSRTNGNAGLGLAITKELINGMGGRIFAVTDMDTLRIVINM